MILQVDAATASVPNGLFVECRGLGKAFSIRGREVQAVKSVDLTLRRGETVLIQGESGAGKSTLLGLLAVLEMPSAGTITIDGVSVDRMQGTELVAWRRRVGIVFQDHNLLLGWTAEENVTAALMGSGMRPAEQRQRAQRALERFGLGERLDHLPGEMSMGERQRVAVARALVREPTFILADEPTGDVDEISARMIVEQLLDASRRPGVTLIVATHGTVRPEFTGRRFAMRSGVLTPENDVR